jgi:ElaB/YqjD/DUF883 family membrane-anchored ribosome-binding protein
MNQHRDPEEAAESAKDHLRAAGGDIKEAISGKAEDIRQAATQKTSELREAAQGKAQEFGAAAERAWADATSQAKTWQTKGEAYARDNPTKAVLIALGAGFVLGLLLRK